MWQLFGISILKICLWEFYTVRKKLAKKVLRLIAFCFAREQLDLSHASPSIQFLTTSSLETRPGWEREVAPISGKTAFIVIHNAAESVPPFGPLCRRPRFEKPALSFNTTPPSPSGRDNSESFHSSKQTRRRHFCSNWLRQYRLLRIM